MCPMKKKIIYQKFRFQYLLFSNSIEIKVNMPKIAKKGVFRPKNPPFWANFAEIFGIDNNPTNTLCVKILAQLDHFKYFFLHLWPNSSIFLPFKNIGGKLGNKMAKNG